MKLKNLQLQLSHTNSGFTLIELLVAVFGFTLIVMGLIGLLSGIFTTYRQQGGLLSDADQARRVAFKIVHELRNAQSNAGNYSLAVTEPQQIIMFSNEDNDPTIERIRYYVSNNQLWKGIIKPTTTPAVYPAGAEQVYKVVDNLGNGSKPVFYYYDDMYYGSTTQTSLSNPVNPTQVRYVQVKLDIYKSAGVVNGSNYTVSAGGAVRILKTNLGN